MIFPSSWTRFTLLTELNLTVPKARPEAHTFDFIFDFITGEGESQKKGNHHARGVPNVEKNKTRTAGG